MDLKDHKVESCRAVLSFEFYLIILLMMKNNHWSLDLYFFKRFFKVHWTCCNTSCYLNCILQELNGKTRLVRTWVSARKQLGSLWREEYIDVDGIMAVEITFLVMLIVLGCFANITVMELYTWKKQCNNIFLFYWLSVFWFTSISNGGGNKNIKSPTKSSTRVQYAMDVFITQL